ncbi:MAG: hypothetical protein OXC91_03330 [Rhodobacteraceae bacterium]|nr:hypothetical protein [Paracoccaceae bacterium]
MLAEATAIWLMLLAAVPLTYGHNQLMPFGEAITVLMALLFSPTMSPITSNISSRNAAGVTLTGIKSPNDWA